MLHSTAYVIVLQLLLNVLDCQFVIVTSGADIHNSTQYKIPKVLYQSWYHKDIEKFSETTRLNMKKNKDLNPDIEFQLWDDKDVEDFIKAEYPPIVYHAYMSINPQLGAAKGDFLRYAILYKRGGMWLDLEAAIRTPNFFGTVIKPEDECILDKRRDDLSDYRKAWGYGTHEQWFLAAMPNHPYFLYAIERIVRSYKRSHTISNGYKNGVLRITGPDAFTAAVHDAIVDHGIRHREIVCDQVMCHFPDGWPGPEYRHSGRRHYDGAGVTFWMPYTGFAGNRSSSGGNVGAHHDSSINHHKKHKSEVF